MNITNLFKRRSVRSFTDQQVEQEKIDYLLQAGLHAPSACNQQPWHLIAVTNKEVIEKLSTTSPYGSFAAKAPLIIVVCKSTSDQLKAPMYYDIDCSNASMNILNACVDVDLGGTWIGTCPQKERMEAVDKVIAMPDGYTAFSLLAIGYPLHPHKIKEVDFSKVSYIK